MAQKTEQMVFRNSFQGYNKEDVNEYIKKLSKDFAKLEEEYKNTIEKKDAEIKKLNEKAVSEGRKSKGNQTAALEAQIAKLNLTIDAQKKEIKDLKEELKKAASANSHVTTHVTTSDALSDEELSRKIGDIFLNANRSADALIAEAKSEAERITTEALREAETLIADAKAKAEALKAAAEQEVTSKFDNIKRNIYILTQNYLADYEKGIEALRTAMEDSIEENSKDLDEAITALREIEIPIE